MPGKFMLSYQPRLKARHEYITVTPEGFRYRKQVFESLNSLLKWFKEHHRDPIPSTPGALSVPNTARTPGGFSLASKYFEVYLLYRSVTAMSFF
jgi:transcription elongation factor SPT6